MLVIQDGPYNMQNINLPQEDAVSLLGYIAQFHVESVTDVESHSKLIFSLLSQLYRDDFFDKFLTMLHNLKENNYILLSRPCDTNLFKLYVRDKFLFKILLFTSLKYRKSLFIQSSASICFLQTTLQEIILSICIVKPPTLHLLKLIEMILKKREDVLTPDLSVFVLQCMNQTAHSPLTGFKHCAQNVSRIVLRSLPDNTKKYLCNFNNLPIKGIDLNDILKLCAEKQIRSFATLINKRILKLFCNNTDSRDGSFYYEALTNVCTFEQFIANVWPHYSSHFQKFEEGEFYQSFLKYWIPITVKRYKHDFYTFVVDENVDFYLRAYTLLETKKKSHYDSSKFDSDTLNFLKYAKTSTIGLKIICTYVKKHIYPDHFAIQAVQSYLNYYSRSELPEDVLKSLKLFVSQMFLVCHLTLNKTDADLSLYSDFLTFVYRFCLSRIDDGENCEIAAQLLKVVWDIAPGASTDLVTSYKIDRENVYETGSNLYYQQLKKTGFWQNTFLDTLLIKRIENFVSKKLKHCPRLTNLVEQRYLEFVNLDNSVNLMTLLDQTSRSICLQSSEKIRIYTSLIMKYKKQKNESPQEDVAKLYEIFYSKIGSLEAQNMFECVLILNVLLIITNYEDLNLSLLIEKSLYFFEKIFDGKLNPNLNTKESKVLEALINNVIEYLITSKTVWSKLDKQQLLDQLCKIIRKSNMKRPVSSAVRVLQCYGAFMEESDYDREMKIKLLDRTLNSLYNNKQSGKIRRNPETRLVIHALCLGDKNLTKPFLSSSLHFMLEVLSNPLSSDSTLSSTLHSLEVLVSDNSIHQFTLRFIVDIIEHCIRLFNKTSWIVRNADLQLLKSLIERFLGVSLDENVRPKTIEDLFVLFPTLIPHFYKILTAPELGDSALIVLLFFSESYIKNDLLAGRLLEDDFDKFRHLFVNIIKNHSNNLGFLAIKAFTALCPDSKIPQVFSQIVHYIQQDFCAIKKNIFANLIKLLRELYQKYKLSLVRTHRNVISDAATNLLNYLKQFDSFYFNLLSFKLCTIGDVTDQVIASLAVEIDFERRIWLNNYLPFIVMETESNRLETVLNRLMANQIPEFLQIKILSILADRIDDNFPTGPVINILILKLTKLADSSKYLIVAYAKCILLFYEVARDFSLSKHIIEIRRDFQTDNIYKIFVYVVVLAHCRRDEQDQEFVSYCVTKYVEAVADDDDEFLVDLATTVVHLYNCSSTSDRFHVIKLVFYLLLNDFTSFEMCKFVSILTKSHSSSILVSLVNLLKFSNLSNYVGEKRLAVRLLSEFYCYIDDLPDELEESDTYYLIEDAFPIPKQYVKTIILHSLSEGDVAST